MFIVTITICLLQFIEYYIKNKFLSNEWNISCIKYNIPGVGYICIYYYNILTDDYIDLIPDITKIINLYFDTYKILAFKTHENNIIPTITDEEVEPNIYTINILTKKYKTIDLKIIISDKLITIYKNTRIMDTNGTDIYEVKL
jgi:hypothetical protein